MTSPALNGTLSVDLPQYVISGESFHLEPTGVYRDDESDTLLSYCWVNPFTSVRDTVREESDSYLVKKDFWLNIPEDTTGTFTLTVYAWATGYSQRTINQTFTVVNPNPDTGSLRGYGFLNELSTFVDSRDSHVYYYTSAAGHDWMISNLNWDGSGEAYEGFDVLSQLYGRYYTWTEAGSACPAGWTLPSDADFVALATAFGGTSSDGVSLETGAGALMGDIYLNGSKMWEFWPSVTITNASRFSAIPVGLAQVKNSKLDFNGFNSYAVFWTSDEVDELSARARYIYVDKPSVFVSALGKESVRASVRCIR